VGEKKYKFLERGTIVMFTQRFESIRGYKTEISEESRG